MSFSDNWCWARFFARWVLGLIFLMSGWYKVFDLTAYEHASRFFVQGYADTWIPSWLLWALGFTIPFVELIAGALVCMGLRLRESLILLGGVLVIVAYGHLLKEPIYDITAHIFPRLTLLLFILMLPDNRDYASLDYWLHYRDREAGP